MLRHPGAPPDPSAHHNFAASFAERLLTVVASCRQQGRPLVEFLVAAGEAALRGSPPPSLLSTPQGT